MRSSNDLQDRRFADAIEALARMLEQTTGVTLNLRTLFFRNA
jgi:hypothetical protein